MDKKFSVKFKNLNYKVQTWPSWQKGQNSKFQRLISLSSKIANSCQKSQLITLHLDYPDSGFKTILNNMCGEFRSGEFSAVIGRSASGKSKFFDVLTGFTVRGVSGSRVFEGPVPSIKPAVRYIMQDYSLHDFISVSESMQFAANLKLSNVSQTCRIFKVSTVRSI